MKIYGDRYNRYDEVDNIVEIIQNCLTLKKPTAFSLEANWGKGKTWILEKIEAKLKGADLSKKVPIENFKNSSNKYFVVKYNAWEKGYCEEPLIAILLSLVNQMNEKLTFSNINNKILEESLRTSVAILENIAGSISKRLLGVNLIDVSKDITRRVKRIKKESNIVLTSTGKTDNIEKDILLIVNTLNKISQNIPIIFIVDELDRCMPETSIKTLERLHHIFSKINNSVTIISIYRAQLENSILKMFGSEISPKQYLRKFIDFAIVLDEGTVDDEELHKSIENFEQLFAKNTTIELNILKEICQKIPSRDFENICRTAELSHKVSSINHDKIPINCLEAELFLHAYRFASRNESNSSNVSLTNGNIPETPFGKYIKDFLKNAREKVYKIEKFGIHTGVYYAFDLSIKETVILFVVSIVYNYNIKWDATTNENKQVLLSLKEYYENYKKYFKLIR